MREIVYGLGVSGCKLQAHTTLCLTARPSSRLALSVPGEGVCKVLAILSAFADARSARLSAG